ncbi:hypothetical protein U8527_04255 [Kordia algicida OT-1]|uniref:Uncharacterized protein n=1 Tax=Kordia algicida OT-1 TaxID=391587 RepID=A9DPV9_9FLAO|nr:hypothetical protein [Kordia algicida]EDP97534.1 hypothetical protein KAOT1_20267 [Kordia algicida OT-1]
MSTQSITCPNCGKGTINFTVEDLLQGKSFKCNICDVSIALGSHKDKVGETLKKFERLK